MTNHPVKVLIIGAGDRGRTLSNYALDHPEEMMVVGVAEPRKDYRDVIVANHGLTEDRVFNYWEEVAKLPRFADAAIICTQDQMHREPAIRFAELGYNILLEKPMSTNPQDCIDIVHAAKENNIIFGVCHVLRYTRYTQMLRKLLNDGAIGDIVSMQHLEPVGYWHQAHSFVRGNWGNEEKSTFMLLSKACHDLDWIRYIMGSRCRKVSSFGNLSHFNAKNKPANASDRCLDCKAEKDCPYSAQKVYLDHRCMDHFLKVLTSEEPTPENVEKALRDGPYGRCVYASDNNVVDHQVVNMEFEGGSTVAFTMTAFTEMSDRKTRIFGSRGWIEGNGETIKVYDFMTEQETVHEVQQFEQNTRLDGHGGGDYYMMKAFVAAVATGDQSKVLSGPDETLESHLMVFLSEKARRESRVVSLNKELL